MSTKKVSLLTAEDIGSTVETTGYVRTEAVSRLSYREVYSDEVRVGGRLDSFLPVPVTPNAAMTPVPKGYELTVGGVVLHVPEKFVVTFPGRA